MKKQVRKLAELSRGSLEWKMYRSTDEMDEFHVRAIKNLVLVTLQLALASVSKGFVELLKSLNLHKRVKTLIRFGWK